jgi:hypothetical protein
MGAENPGGRPRGDAVRVVAMDADDRAAWDEQRRQAVAGHAAALEAGRAAEARQAGELLAAFVRRAAERGLAPELLRARAFDGHATYRTRLRGWYLKANRSVAVGEDGAFYVLSVPSSLRARFTGADVSPSAPRLIVGAGGGDGETMPLEKLLQRRLDAGAEWP